VADSHSKEMNDLTLPSSLKSRRLPSDLLLERLLAVKMAMHRFFRV